MRQMILQTRSLRASRRFSPVELKRLDRLLAVIDPSNVESKFFSLPELNLSEDSEAAIKRILTQQADVRKDEFGAAYLTALKIADVIAAEQPNPLPDFGQNAGRDASGVRENGRRTGSVWAYRLTQGLARPSFPAPKEGTPDHMRHWKIIFSAREGDTLRHNRDGSAFWRPYSNYLPYQLLKSRLRGLFPSQQAPRSMWIWLPPPYAFSEAVRAATGFDLVFSNVPNGAGDVGSHRYLEMLSEKRHPLGTHDLFAHLQGLWTVDVDEIADIAKTILAFRSGSEVLRPFYWNEFLDSASLQLDQFVDYEREEKQPLTPAMLKRGIWREMRETIQANRGSESNQQKVIEALKEIGPFGRRFAQTFEEP